MNPSFFEKPILNSPYQLPTQHWELDDTGQPTQKIIETCRNAKFISPIAIAAKLMDKNRVKGILCTHMAISIRHHFWMAERYL